MLQRNMDHIYCQSQAQGVVIGNEGTVRQIINFVELKKKLRSEAELMRKGLNLFQDPLAAMTTCDRLGPSVVGWKVGEGGKRKFQVGNSKL